MDQNTFLEKVAEVLDCPDTISADQSLEDVPEWDSLGVLAIVDFFEENGVEVDLQKLVDISSVKELVALSGLITDE